MRALVDLRVVYALLAFASPLGCIEPDPRFQEHDEAGQDESQVSAISDGSDSSDDDELGDSDSSDGDDEDDDDESGDGDGDGEDSDTGGDGEDSDTGGDGDTGGEDDPEVCGAPGDSCYEDLAAMAARAAVTPSGKSLVYVDADGSGSRQFWVWKEADGNRVLRAHGYDEWAQGLVASGKGFSGAWFSDPGLTSETSLLAGRVCPFHVYIDDHDRWSVGKCLYWTLEAMASSLDSAGTSQGGSGGVGLGPWNFYTDGPDDAHWYTGNVETCASIGMRLPTAFESSTAIHESSLYPIGDGTPVFAGIDGVPCDHRDFWVATGSSVDVDEYWVCGGATASHDLPVPVVCVLP